MPVSLEASMRLAAKFAVGGAEASTAGMASGVGAMGITDEDAGGRAGEGTALAIGTGTGRTGIAGATPLGAACETC